MVYVLAVGVAGHGDCKYCNKRRLGEFNPIHFQTVSAEGIPEAQPSVWTENKEHALFLWIELNPKVDGKKVAKVAASLQTMVDKITDPSMRDEKNEIVAGVGFGSKFYKQIGGKAKQNYTYVGRTGIIGALPSSAGDIFIHAKSNTHGKLFELAQSVLKKLPKGSVKNAEETYSFAYKINRDLSGFIDGTENPAEKRHRQKVAVETETGGSYVLTQKWIHDMKIIDTTSDKILEDWVGRTRADSIELKHKPITAHIARMTGGNAFQNPKAFEIVRQSLPYGSVTGEAGLFVIAYAASPDNFNFMLNRMVGKTREENDDIMLMSRNVKGAFWYFPGVDELKRFA